MELNDDISLVKGVGEKTKSILEKLDIFTIYDMINYFPRNYEKYKDIIRIDEIQEGELVVIESKLSKGVSVKNTKGLNIVSCTVCDLSKSIELIWFNTPYLKNLLKFNEVYIFRGRAVMKFGKLIIEHPQIMSREEYYSKKDLLLPIYPLTAGITNNMLTKILKTIFQNISSISDFLPNEIKVKYNLIDLNNALYTIHFPKDNEQLINARKRIVFNEFFLFSINIRTLKEKKINNHTNFIMKDFKIAEKVFLDSLSFKLTDDQLKTWNSVKKDLKNDIPMNRLIQGDVGSGKTIIAALALLLTAKNGYQGMIMAPTEVLANQHYKTLSELFKKFGIRVGLLTGSITTSQKRKMYDLIKNQEIDIIVGTHALIQEKVEYSNPALVVIDEQHRFGVKQREMLSNKGKSPHIMIMSATPIPRTLALMLYGDLDISYIKTMPKSRLPIKNCVIENNLRYNAYKFIQKEIKNGRQVYIICPMVEESEIIEAESVIEYTQLLKEKLSSNIVIQYLHGKMKPKEKNDIMNKFSNKEIDLLVSTTVVEVGVNVPNATVIMIENAERFGLAQLHQLRGRVGRGKYQSYAIFINGKKSKEAKERLEILAQSNDGFFIAEQDLKFRGQGDIFGIRQNGDIDFKVADIIKDADILQIANEAVKSLTNKQFEEIYKIQGKNIQLVY